MAPGKNKAQRPEARGFERVFSLLGGSASHFDDALPLSESERPHTLYDDDGKDVTASLPGDFYSTYHYTAKMIEFLRSPATDKPFFAYLAYAAPHDPLPVPDEWLERYKGGAMTAATTPGMAQSRSTAPLTRSTRRSPAAWEWACRSRDPSSRRMADDCGPH